MGKIRHRIIKNSARDIYAKMADKVSTSFDENKELLKGLNLTSSSKVRNRIAGYLVRVAKKEE